MAINLNNKVSSKDVELVSNAKQGKDYRDGFGPDDVGGSEVKEDGYDDFFDSLSDDDGFFGGGDDSDWGASSVDKKENSTGSSWGDGNSSGGWGDLDKGNQTQNQEAQKGYADKAVEATIDKTIEVSKNTFSILVAIPASLRNRTLDDIGFIGNRAVKVGGIVAIIGLLSIIGFSIGGLGNSAWNLGIDVIAYGISLFGVGASVLAISAFLLSRHMDRVPNKMEEVEDIPQSAENELSDDDNDDLWGDIFGDGADDDEDPFSDGGSEWEDNDEEEKGSSSFGDSLFDGFDGEREKDSEGEVKSTEELLESVNENSFISRKLLVDTFKNILPRITPKFDEVKMIDEFSEEYKTIDTICLKALTNLLNCGLEELDQHVESIGETLFSYEIRIKRVRKLTKTVDIERELESYFRENSKDISVVATVDIEGDFYKMVVSKGVSKMVTLGDILASKDGYEFFSDEKVKLPLVCGLNELGQIVRCDCKESDNMIIAGKPNSGKSWFILNVLLSFVLFNTPEDVQLIIVDPKETALFETLALMPHVCGLHNDTKILQIMDELIEVEAPSRKQILKDNRCDDIWALRKKGIKLPLLYLVIDEYITVRNRLGDESKELDTKLQILISQFRSLGIRLIFVPHRATGVVDKTNRTMLQFKAAVKSDISEVKDTLDDAKWSRALTLPGDIAIKSPSMQCASYIRGLAIGEDDDQNKELMRVAAKVFYKMGVDIPDMSNLQICCNRDPDKIREELSGETMREQYNVNNIFSEDNKDLDEDW